MSPSYDREIVECYSYTYEHSNFNAAMLGSVMGQNIDEARVLFTARLNHWEEVLEAIGRDVQVDFLEVESSVPSFSWIGSRGAYVRQLLTDLSAAWFVRARMLRSDASTLYVATSTPLMILALSALSCFRRESKPEVVIVCHGFLAALAAGSGANLRARLAAKSISMGSASGFRFLCLSPSIKQAVERLDPLLGGKLDAINYPILETDMPVLSISEKPEVLTLGFLGPGIPRKGYGQYLELARRVGERGSEVDFKLIGYAPDLDDASEAVLGDVQRTPVPSGRVQLDLSRVHYLVWTGSPTHYSLTASSTIADAMSLGVPGIFLRNEFVDYYYDANDPFGYIVESIDEMQQVIEELARGLDPTRYASEQAAAQRTAEGHRPVAVSQQLESLYSRVEQ